MVAFWTGAEADALRQAMRLSLDDFAQRTQVSRRSVAKWRRGGTGIRLRWDTQRLLDRLLASADDQVRSRFEELLKRPVGMAEDRRPELGALVHAMLSEAREPDQPLFALEKALAHIHIAVQACDYRLAISRLSELMPLPSTSARVAKLAADAYVLAAGLLLKHGEPAAAMLAAQRCEQLAAQHPLTRAAGIRMTASVLQHTGHFRQAAELAQHAAGEVRGVDEPRPRSAFGALLLRAAVAHAHAGARTEAMTLIGEASVAASAFEDDANFGWTAFCPADVELHRIDALLALGDPGMALHVAGALDPDRVRLTERKANLFLNTARALRTLGRPAGAAVRRAETVAPQEVRLAPAAWATTTDGVRGG